MAALALHRPSNSAMVSSVWARGPRPSSPYKISLTSWKVSQSASNLLNHRSPLALIPIEKLFAGRKDILVYTPKSSSDYAQSDDPFDQALDTPVVVSLSQR